MAVLQGAAAFRGYGLLEQLNSDAPRVGNRLFNRAWGEVSGISADPPGGPPGGDPVVLALQAKLLKTQGNIFP